MKASNLVVYLGRHESSDNDGYVSIGGADWLASGGAGLGRRTRRRTGRRVDARAPHGQTALL